MNELVYLADVSPYESLDGKKEMAGVHRSLGSAGSVFREIAQLCGLSFVGLDTVRDLDVSVLESARLLVLFTIGETPWSMAQREVIERRTSEGGLGLVGVHAATDSAYSWPAFGELIGARFDGHPVTGALPILVVDPTHPATAHLPSPWRFEEEFYLFRDLAADARVLLGVEFNSSVLPLAWCIDRGACRTFYTVLGHFLGAYEDGNYLRHLHGAVRWVLGEDGAD